MYKSYKSYSYTETDTYFFRPELLASNVKDVLTKGTGPQNKYLVY